MNPTLKLPQHPMLLHLILIICVISVEFIFFTASFGYSVVKDFAIWYFPLGFHFILFLVLPYKFWPSALIALGIGAGLTMYYQGSVYYDWSRHFMVTLTTSIFTLPIIFLARKSLTKIDFFSLKAIVTVVLFGMLSRLTNIGFHFLTNTSVYDKVPNAEKFGMFLQHNIAAYPGILLTISLYCLYRWYRNTPQPINSQILKLSLRFAIGLTSLILLLFFISDFSQNLLKLLLILPIIWFGYRYTWIASIVGAIWINLILLVLLYDAPPELLIAFQPFVVSYFLIGLLTAGLQLEHDAIYQTLQTNHQQLNVKYHELRQNKQQLQDMAKEIMAVQELEKKNVSQELHDDLGQNITALRMAIPLLEKNSELTSDNRHMLQKIKITTDEIYSNAYDLMYWLRPRMVDDLGLSATLTGHFFTLKLAQANITYTPLVENGVNELSDSLKIGLFRIVQECVNNVIEHSQAHHCRLNLHLFHNVVTLEFVDNGKGFSQSVLAQPLRGGLFNIHNHMLALNGNLFLSNEEGARVYVELPIER